MIKRSHHSNIPCNLVWRYSGTPLPGSTAEPVNETRASPSVWSEGWSKDVYRVDPIGRFYHGRYRFESMRLSHIPNVTAELSFKSVGVTNGSQYGISVTGDGFGFVIPRCRWLYENEKNYFGLINNCIKGAMEQHANLAMFIADLGKSMDLLANTANKISSAASAVRAGKFTRASRILGIRKPGGVRNTKSFANNWLEYTYGWTPLLLDSVGIMKHVYQGARKVNIKAKSRVTSVIPLSHSAQVQLERQAASQHRLLCTWRSSGKWTRNEQVQLLFRLPSNFWDQASRLGFIDPGTLALEAIPGSFMLNWFSNLGDWMASLNLGLTLEYVTGSYVEYHRNVGSLYASSIYWADTKPSLFKYQANSASASRSSFEEVKLKREPIPEQHVAVSLMLDAPLSTNRAITAASLVVQQLKR